MQKFLANIQVVFLNDFIKLIILYLNNEDFYKKSEIFSNIILNFITVLNINEKSIVSNKWITLNLQSYKIYVRKYIYTYKQIYKLYKYW